MTRREFLSRLSALSTAALPLLLFPAWLPRLSRARRSRDPLGAPKQPTFPPGGRSLRRFTAACTACGRCVAACPTHVIQPALLEYGLRGLLQPALDFNAGSCDYLCTRCGEVCPTGAIAALSVAEKTRTKIGTVRFVRQDCIVFTQGTPCGACSEICPTQAIRMVPYRPGLTQPLTDEALCIGCGACEHVCPARPRKAVYVEGLDPHTLLPKPTSAPPAAPAHDSRQGAPAPPTEFPF